MRLKMGIVKINKKELERETEEKNKERNGKEE